MTVTQAIKLLEKNGFTFVHQIGSHRKYAKGSLRHTVVYHGTTKEELCKKGIKSLNLVINESNKSTSSNLLSKSSRR